MAEKKGLDPIQKELLAQVADLHKMPEGAYSLRINGQLEGKNSSEHIQIVKKTDAPGIDIYIQPGTKNESMHIPVIIEKSGLQDLVYNYAKLTKAEEKIKNLEFIRDELLLRHPHSADLDDLTPDLNREHLLCRRGTGPGLVPFHIQNNIVHCTNLCVI